MSLSQRQCAFAHCLASLIQQAEGQGLDVKIAAYLRTIAEEQAEIDAGRSALKNPQDSKHVQGLAVDIALFRNGVLLEDHDSYAALGAWWVAATGGQWGGDWKSLDDFDHFEI